MSTEYLWDTNTVIYYLQSQFPSHAEQKIDNVLLVSTPTLSIITEIELLSWRYAIEEDVNTINTFLLRCYIYPLDINVKLQTINLRKKTNLKLPDALIAATALAYNKTLITRNLSDFEKVPHLNLLNPFEVSK